MRLVTPMLSPLAGLIAGIMITRIGAGLLTALVLIIIGLGLYFLFTYKNTNPMSALRIAPWHHLWVIILFAGIGNLDAIYHSPTNWGITMQGYPGIKGYVRDVDHTTSGDRLYIEVRSLIDKEGQEHSVAPAGALVYSKSSGARVDDVVITSNTLEPLTDSPNSFDSGYADMMEKQGIIYVGYLRENHRLNILGQIKSIKGVAWECRQSLIEFIEHTAISMPAKSFIISILLGERSYLHHDNKEIFSNAGISHILALSGMHVGIITGIILWLLFPLNMIRKRLWRYTLVIPILWGYAWITGLMPSTVRASVMATLFIGAILLERKSNPWNSLLAATFIILLCSPFDIYDIGLQLSFTCVAGIIFFGRKLNPVDRHSHPFTYRLMELILVSLIATGCSWIISAYYFGKFPLMFFPANIIVLPLLPIFVVTVLIYLVLFSIGIKVSILADLINFSYEGFTHLLSFISHDGNSTVDLTVPGISVWCWLLAVALIAVFIYHRQSIYLAIAPLILVIFAILMIPLSSTAEEIIVRSGGRYPEISYKDKSGIRDYAFRVNAVSSLKIGEYHFIVADCNIDTLKDCGKVDYLILTRSCTTPISIINENIQPSTIILHSSISRSREAYIMNLADSLSIHVHSLRLNSSLRLKAFLE